MAMDKLSFTGEDASRAMLLGLTEAIRDRLRERIMERIKPDVEAAIEESLAAFKATITSYTEAENMRDTVRVIIENKTKQ